jgi:hypothetical protein
MANELTGRGIGILPEVSGRFLRPQGMAASPGNLTVVQNIYHRAMGGKDPIQVASRYSRMLGSTDDARVLKLNVTSQVAALVPEDIIPPEGYGIIILISPSLETHGVIPSEEAKAGHAAKVVVVSLGGEPFARLRPGESLPFEPTNPGRLGLTCLSGEITITAVLIPA